MNNISFLFPVYNEEKRIKNLKNFILWIKKERIKNCEIVIISNGSTDNTYQEVKKIKEKFRYIKYFFTNKASRGVAIKLGIKKSKNNLVALCAIDNAWDLNFYTKSYKVIKNSNFDVIFGPKTHLNSKINRPIIRKIISLICTIYLKLLFGNKIDASTFSFSPMSAQSLIIASTVKVSPIAGRSLSTTRNMPIPAACFRRCPIQRTT